MKKITAASAALATMLSLPACAATGTGAKPMIEEAATPNEVERGSISEASYYNAASALLYRWWGLFEAPDGTDLEPFLVDLFADDVHIKMTNIDITGIDAVKAGIAALPANTQQAHHIKSIKVTNLGNGVFRLNAEFIYQTLEPDGTLRSGDGFYEHWLKEQPDGKLLFTKITAHLGDPVEIEEFKPTYIENRAKAVVIQFQTVMDTLSGDASGLRELVKPDVEFKGLLAPPEDKDDLDNWDATVRGMDGLQAWFAEGPKVFRSVSHVSLEEFSVNPLGENRYSAIAQFDWQAETLDGKKLEQHTPRTWILIDEGEKYMRVESSY